MRRSLIVALLCLAGCGEKEPPGVVRRKWQPDYVQKFDEQRMDRAIAEARETLGDFVKALEANKKETDGFNVKKGYGTPGNEEFIWITNVRLVDGAFEGEINNEPVHAGVPKLGQTVRVARNEAVDWFYQDRGRLRGGYTIVALVYGTSEQASYEKEMGIDWSRYRFLKK